MDQGELVVQMAADEEFSNLVETIRVRGVREYIQTFLEIARTRLLRVTIRWIRRLCTIQGRSAMSGSTRPGRFVTDVVISVGTIDRRGRVGLQEGVSKVK